MGIRCNKKGGDRQSEKEGLCQPGGLLERANALFILAVAASLVVPADAFGAATLRGPFLSGVGEPKYPLALPSP